MLVTSIPRLGPLARLQLLKDVRAWARLAGAADERGELGTMGTAVLQFARGAALTAGCRQWDVDTATMDGTIEGRAGLREQRLPLVDVLAAHDEPSDLRPSHLRCDTNERTDANDCDCTNS